MNLAVSPSHLLNKSWCQTNKFSQFNSRSLLTFCQQNSGNNNKSKVVPLLEEANTPWKLGFQLNERYTDWNSTTQAELIKLVVAEKLGKDVEYVEERIQEVCTLLPDVGNRLRNLKPDLLVDLIENIKIVPEKCIRLKELLPNVDLSEMIARSIPIFIDTSIEEMEQNIVLWEQELQISRQTVERLIIQEPAILRVKATEVVKELQRLLPNKNPKDIILQDPLKVLAMSQAGQMSSVERNQ